MNQPVGAAFQSAVPTPEVDLAKLAGGLVAALHNASEPLLKYDRQRRCVVISPSHVLLALPNDEVFVNTESDRHNWKTTRIGGRIVHGTDIKLKEALFGLEGHIAREFDALCAEYGFSPGDLVITKVQEELAAMGKRVNGYMDRSNSNTVTRLQTTTFIDPSTPGLSATGRVGRVMSAVESLESGDRLELFLASLERLMLHDDRFDRTTDEVREVLNDLRSNYHQQDDKQLKEFIRFLDDDGAGQARIRLAVSRDIMDAIRRIALRSHKDLNAQLAAEYIRRVLALVEVDSPEIDLDQHYGTSAGAKFLLSTELAKSTFYFFLPVWCYWETPMLEVAVNTDDDRPALQRHIGYRFKVNGKDPEWQIPGFELRLKRLEETLLPKSLLEKYQSLTRSLAQLLSLAAVVPRDAKELDVDIADKVQRGVAYLNQRGQRAIKSILEELKKRDGVMKNIANAITKILRQRGEIIDELARRPRAYYLNVLRGILNERRALNGQSTPLITPSAGQNQQAAFFSCTQVTKDQPLPDALFSLQTKVILKESLLYAEPDAISRVLVQRHIPEHLVQVIWHPATLTGVQQADRWRLRSASIAVEYSQELLGLSDQGNKPNSTQRLRLAVLRTAFAVLTYIALKLLCERINKLRTNATRVPLTALMLRLQDQGRDDNNLSSSIGVYAISQALEHALGQHLRVRMQGLTYTGDEASQGHKRTTTFSALFSAFPLLLQTPQPPTIDKVGVLTFVSRTATDHLSLTADEDKDFLLVGRAYQAIADTHLPGYKLFAHANLLAVESGRDTFTNSPAILDAVKRLYASGCKHIIYMGQRRNARQLGRGAIAHRHHEKPEFLAEIQSRFPDLQLYPMAHDVFPATRLRKRNGEQDAFEVLNYQAHLKVWDRDWAKLHERDLVPIYSLATLHVVGEKKDEKSPERPQSGFATYFLLTDPARERLEQETSKRLALIAEYSPLRHDLIAVLRGIHYFESEARAVKSKEKGESSFTYIRPVLHPYFALQPVNIAGAGEFVIHPKTKNTTEVVLSLAAVLAQITSVLKANTTPSKQANNITD